MSRDQQERRSLDGLMSSLTRVESELSVRDTYDLLVALFAVGLAVAACDGEIHPKELAEIDVFTKAVATATLPPSVKDQIRQLRHHPPGFEAAVRRVRRVDPALWPLFDTVVDVVIAADGVRHQEELVFLDSWRRFRGLPV